MDTDLALFLQAKRFGALPTLLQVFEHEVFSPFFFNALSASTRQRCLCIARGLLKVGAAGALCDILSCVPFASSSSVGKHLIGRKRARSTEGGECHFYLRPPCVEPQLFVRVIISRGGVRQHFGAEEINRFFARYGFVGCEKLTEAGSFAPNSSVLFEDFRVSLDSVANAVAAVIEVDSAETPFVAFSSASQNAFSAQELPPLEHYVDSMLSGFLTDEPETVGGEDFRTPRRTPHGDSHSDSHRKVLEAFAREQAMLSDYGASPTELGEPASWIDTYETEGGFVPEIVIEGIPYWMTVDQIREHCSQFGRVKRLRLSIHDRCGVALGAALVEMHSIGEALRLSEGLHGQTRDGSSLICGILTRDLRIVSLRDEKEVRCTGSSILGTPLLDLHERRWL